MANLKVITVRVDPEDARRAEICARVDGISVNEVFRRAVLLYFEQKRSDPEFVAKAQALIARDAEIVGGLG